MRKVVLNWVGSPKVVKKNNAQRPYHDYHVTAVRILKEDVTEKAETLQKREAEHLASSTKSSTEESIFIHVSQLNQTQREQLLKRFQLTLLLSPVICYLRFSMKFQFSRENSIKLPWQRISG